MLFASPATLTCHRAFYLSSSLERKNTEGMDSYQRLSPAIAENPNSVPRTHVGGLRTTSSSCAGRKDPMLSTNNYTHMHKTAHMHTNESKSFFSASSPCELLYKTSISLYGFLFYGLGVHNAIQTSSPLELCV